MTDQEIDSLLLSGFIPTGGKGFIKVEKIWFVIPDPEGEGNSLIYYSEKSYLKVPVTCDEIRELIVKCRQLRKEYGESRNKSRNMRVKQ